MKSPCAPSAPGVFASLPRVHRDLGRRQRHLRLPPVPSVFPSRVLHVSPESEAILRSTDTVCGRSRTGTVRLTRSCTPPTPGAFTLASPNSTPPHITRRLLELETSRCWRSRKLKSPDEPLAIHYSSFFVLTRLALQERRLSLFLAFRSVKLKWSDPTECALCAGAGISPVLTYTMFSKIFTFGIGALALVQGALAIAPGRYIIANPEFGNLVSLRKGDPIALSRAPVPSPFGPWNVEQSGPNGYTITNDDAAVYVNENTLFTGDHADTYSIEDAGSNQFVIRVPQTNLVWTAGQIDDPTAQLDAFQIYWNNHRVRSQKDKSIDDNKHTIFEGEGVGGCLAMALLLRLPDVQGTVTIVVDSQPAVKATRVRAPNPSHWIWDIWHGLACAFAQQNPQAHIVVRWAPGHVSIAGNKRANKEAHRAAQGKDSSDQRDILQPSRPATLELLCDAAIPECQWRASSRYASTMQYNGHLLKGTYLDLANNLPHSLAVLLLQLRTGHADEYVSHFLLHCPEHLCARQELYRTTGPNVYVLHKLLGSPKLLPRLFRYLGRTGRFHTVHGTLPTLPDPDPNKPMRHEMYRLLNTIRIPTMHACTADPFNADTPVGFLTAWVELQAALCNNPPAT
ncbi:hypothetical protein DFH08DRAFT_1084675 [Mycena albidolilacea]|uniref:RNase H type-1 domain-containing protein n=1 Tax=Mycena albidolilacea TaxID=1033008 RepID=A0AAD7EI26_9AGAR|nr:hypothetical protein DFH08DRAFT_1084675 [Mycena albidolilacea]